MPNPKKRVLQLQKNAKHMRELRLAQKKKETQVTSSAITPTSSTQLTSPGPPSRSPTTAAPSKQITSAVKRKSLLGEIKIESGKKEDNFICSESDISVALSDLLCPECVTANMKIKYVHHQIDTYMLWSCAKCGHVSFDNTGKIKDVKEVDKQKYYPKTSMLIYCMMMLGRGFSGVEKLVVSLGLKHFAFKTFTKYAEYITKCAVTHTGSILEESRKVIFDKHEKNENGIADISVSYDGTWHKRGFRSNFGVGAVIETDFGHILDYEVLSLLCEKCNNKKGLVKQGKMSDTDYINWLDAHKNSSDCQQNYTGSSGGMEAKSAVLMWGRSLDYNLRYMHMVSDGDSSTYSAIKSMNEGNGPYGNDATVAKLECVNHVAKRFGHGAREAKRKFIEHDTEDEEEEPEPTTTRKKKAAPKKKRRLSMGGRNKLTDIVIDHLQYYFTVSMNRKIGTSPEEMRKEILSTFYHCSSSDDNPQHHLCAEGPDSWCFYNKAIALKKTPDSHKKMKIYFRLTKKQLDVLKQVYDRLTTNEMMEKCIQGLTQNRNESLHQRIWQICPKHMRATKRKVDFGTATAVSRYNKGYMGASLCKILGVEHTEGMVRYLQKMDEKMDTPIRRKMRKNIARKDLEYAAGAF